MSYVYEPSHKLFDRIHRRATVKLAQNKKRLTSDKAIISFSFDDCPVSGITNGVKLLEAENWSSTIYVSCGLFEVENHLGKMMQADDVKALYVNGHEIGEHTYSHKDSKTLGIDGLLADIERNQETLDELGCAPSKTFAYPYGETFPALKKVLQDKFTGSRGINNTIHRKYVDLNQIGSLPLYSDTLDDAIEAVHSVVETGGWLTFFTHDVRDNPSKYGCTPDIMKSIIKTVKNTGAEVLNIETAISALGGTA